MSLQGRMFGNSIALKEQVTIFLLLINLVDDDCVLQVGR